MAGDRNSPGRRNLQTTYETVIESIRLHRKGKVYKAYFPLRLVDALQLDRDNHTLVAVCDGRAVILLLDTQIALRLEPEIQAARRLYVKLKRAENNNANLFESSHKS